MQTAYLGPEPDARHLTYHDDVNNTRSKSRFESKDETTDGSFWSIRGGSTNVSLSGRNQDAIPSEFSLRDSMSRYFLAEINTNWTDGLLIVCAFVSGLVDGLSFNAWGSFSSMQSGPSSILMAMMIHTMLTDNRKLRFHSPRRCRPTRLSSLPLGQVPHRPFHLPNRKRHLHPSLPRPPPPPSLHPRPIIQRPNRRPPRRGSPHPTRRRRKQARRPPCPDPMDASPPHFPPRLSSRGPNRCLACAVLRRDTHRCLDHFAL